MNIDEKKQIVNDFHEKFKKSKVVIITDYKGLDVATINDLRRKLREADVKYKVIKNTLVKIASKDTDVALLEDQLKGPNAFAFSYEDPVSPAKVLVEFARDHKKLQIKGGVLDGKVLDIHAIKALAALPSREALLSQVLSTMNAVPTSFVRTLSEVPKMFVNVIQAIKDQKEAA